MSNVFELRTDRLGRTDHYRRSVVQSSRLHNLYSIKIPIMKRGSKEDASSLILEKDTFHLSSKKFQEVSNLLRSFWKILGK